MTAWYRARFLFCSFGPLYLLLMAGLLAQRDWNENFSLNLATTSIFVSALFFILSIVIFWNLQSNFESASPMRDHIEPLESLDESVLSYMLSYIPPLMIDNLGDTAKIAPATVFYAVMIIIMFKTNIMYVNPYFLLFGYRILKAKLYSSSRTVIIITKKVEILPNEYVELHEISTARLFYAP